MSQGPEFRFDYSFEYGVVQAVAPGIRRVVARNPSAFTFQGTGTYVVGEGSVAVIDPVLVQPYQPASTKQTAVKANEKA